MTKLLSRILIIIICVSLLLVGCSGTSKTEKEDEVQPVGGNGEKEEEVEETGETQYVIEWCLKRTDALVDDPEIVKMIEEKHNVKINAWNLEPNQQYELLGIKIAAGEIPDVFTVNGYNNYRKYVDEGVLIELDEDIVKEYAPNVYAIYMEENPDALKYYKINGKLYGLPVYRDHYIYNRTPVVWRGDWLKNVGIEKTPETVEEFEEALYKFTNDDPDMNGEKDTYGMSTTGIDLFWGAFGIPKGIWDEKDGRLVYGSVQPELKQALEYLAKWYKDGVIDPEFVTGENEGGYWAITHAFINGKIGLTGHGAYYHWVTPMKEGQVGRHNYLELEKVNPEAAKQLVIGMPPKGPDGKMGVTQEQIIEGGGNGTVFTINLKDDPGKLKKILQIFDWVHENEENYLSARWGIKEVHWEPDEDNGVKYIDENFKAAAHGGNTFFILVEPVKFMKAAQGAQLVEFAEHYNFKTGGVQNKLLTSLPSQPQYEAELQKLESEAFNDIITGVKPVDYFDEFIEQWYKLGGQVLEEEANEWYSSFK
ncbi:MAG: extracellular solute-binding protein [Clostridiales bacterium]|jgi:putative aldouronate transport system substrate-binding protein|nr:extracellular solute-binding protein [Clostridiales bacterium]